MSPSSARDLIALYVTRMPALIRTHERVLTKISDPYTLARVAMALRELHTAIDDANFESAPTGRVLPPEAPEIGAALSPHETADV